MRKTNHLGALADRLRARAAKALFWVAAACVIAAAVLVPVKS